LSWVYAGFSIGNGNCSVNQRGNTGQKHLTFFEIVCGKNCYKWANFDSKVEKILGKRLKNGLQVGRKPILFLNAFALTLHKSSVAYILKLFQNGRS
jgi:hypothetical protein